MPINSFDDYLELLMCQKERNNLTVVWNLIEHNGDQNHHTASCIHGSI